MAKAFGKTIFYIGQLKYFTLVLHHFTLALQPKQYTKASFEPKPINLVSMKKNITLSILAIAFISFIALGLINTNHNPMQQTSCKSISVADTIPLGPYQFRPDRDFIFRIGNRFNTTVTLNQIKSAKSFLELIPEDAYSNLSNHKLVKTDTLPNNNRTAIIGDSEKINSRQKQMLNDMSVSSNFYFESYCDLNNAEGGLPEAYNLVYYITVVPEMAAQNSLGFDAINRYLRKETESLMYLVDWERLWPGKVAFTITKKGEIKRVVTESACGQKDIDQKMIELVEKMPGKWQPAKNDKGKPIAQEFVLFYGMEGC